jgi:hypothetical protein
MQSVPRRMKLLEKRRWMPSFCGGEFDAHADGCFCCDSLKAAVCSGVASR